MAGTMLGLALGLVVSLALGTYKLIPLDPSVYFIDHLPVATEWTDVVLTVVASVAIAALATLYPAQQAAKLYPDRGDSARVGAGAGVRRRSAIDEGRREPFVAHSG